MIKGIVFHGRKEFQAEYYATEIKNRSRLNNQDDGYYKGFGNELSYSLVGNTTFRVNSGLFLVQGRQCVVVPGTTEDIEIPVQNSKKYGFIIARIKTFVSSGENVEITYKLSDSGRPNLVQQDTYNISPDFNAIYELPLYSFTIDTKITDIQKEIHAIPNTEIGFDSGSGIAGDYIANGGIFFKKDNKINGLVNLTRKMDFRGNVENISLNAQALQGFFPEKGDSFLTTLQNTIPVRDDNGYIYANKYVSKMSSVNSQDTNPITNVYATYDNEIKKYSSSDFIKKLKLLTEDSLLIEVGKTGQIQPSETLISGGVFLEKQGE